MPNNKGPANQRLRLRIHGIVNELIIGETIRTGNVAMQLRKSRCISFDNHRIGRLLAEFEILKSEGRGVFRRVK
jgi:hypothetical protein